MRPKITYQKLIKTIVAIIVLISSLAATYTFSPFTTFRQITQTELVLFQQKKKNSKAIYYFFFNKNINSKNQSFPYLFENALRNFNQQIDTQFQHTNSDLPTFPMPLQQTKLIPKNDEITTNTRNI